MNTKIHHVGGVFLYVEDGIFHTIERTSIPVDGPCHSSAIDRSCTSLVPTSAIVRALGLGTGGRPRRGEARTKGDRQRLGSAHVLERETEQPVTLAERQVVPVPHPEVPALVAVVRRVQRRDQRAVRVGPAVLEIVGDHQHRDAHRVTGGEHRSVADPRSDERAQAPDQHRPVGGQEADRFPPLVGAEVVQHPGEILPALAADAEALAQSRPKRLRLAGHLVRDVTVVHEMQPAVHPDRGRSVLVPQTEVREPVHRGHGEPARRDARHETQNAENDDHAHLFPLAVRQIIHTPSSSPMEKGVKAYLANTHRLLRLNFKRRISIA